MDYELAIEGVSGVEGGVPPLYKIHHAKAQVGRGQLHHKQPVLAPAQDPRTLEQSFLEITKKAPPLQAEVRLGRFGAACSSLQAALSHLPAANLPREEAVRNAVILR